MKIFLIQRLRSAVGSFIYLAICTRPEILFAVNQASKHYQEPTEHDWKNVVQIFRYLKRTSGYGILFKGKGNLKTHVDSNYGGDKETRKSITGFIFFIGSGPTSWNSKAQDCIATSTAEAEYYTLNECAKQGLWYRNFMYELYGKDICIKIHMDNRAAIYNANNETINQRSKHFDIKYHKVRELIKEEKIELQYIESKNYIADGFTKFLNGNKMQEFLDKVLYKFK